jgi:anti-sigma B factor antagonist
MSSAGLRELVNALKKLKRVAGDLRIAQPSKRVREVMEMAGLDTIFLIFETSAEAVESF